MDRQTKQAHGAVDPALSAQQSAAVNHTGGPACVLAGAGTGKTRVIAARFERLVAEGTPPGRILVLTFSRQAAEEMRARIASRLTSGYPRLSIGTFHSFCLEHLTRAAVATGRTAPTVIADGARQAMLAPLLAGLSPQYYTGMRARQFLTDALTFIDRASDELVAVKEYERLLAGLATGQLCDVDGSNRRTEPERLARLRDLAAARDIYISELTRRQALDYGSMVGSLIDLWRRDSVALRIAQQAHDHILVDEFQDVNGAQFALVRLLAEAHGRLMVVGDDDQAIYAFRGASDRFIRDFRSNYPEAKLYDLTENHRSHQRILDAANAAIAPAHADNGRCLRSAAGTDGPLPRLAVLANQTEEAAWIADRVARLIEDGRRPQDIGVLVRSAQMLQPITEALLRRAIAVAAATRESRPDQVAADALALLNLTEAPTDEQATRVLAGALPPADFLAAVSAAEAREVAVRDYLFEPTIARTDAVETLRLQLASLVALAPQERVYQAILMAVKWAGPRATASWPALRQLMQDADACLRGGETLAAFVAAYQPPTAELPVNEAVTVLTAHAAKGLEFPVTFIAGLADGLFPVSARLDPVFDLAAIRAWLDGSAYMPRSESERQRDQLLEERRLFYVSVTRAREDLILSTARSYGSRAVEPSPFVQELLTSGLIETEKDTGLAIRPSALDVVNSARGDLLSLAAPVPPVGAPPVILDRGLRARHILATAPGATDLVPNAPAAPFAADRGLRTSVSALETYTDCPRQFFFDQCLKLPSEAALPVSFGNALHLALATFNNKRKGHARLPSTAQLLGWWRESLQRDAFESSLQYDQSMARGELLLGRYQAWEEKREREQPGREVLSVEEKFTFTFTDSSGCEHEFRGKCDVIIGHSDGSLEIIDYKGGHRRGRKPINKQPRAGSANNPDRSWQLAVYHLAVAARFERPVRTTFCFLGREDDTFGLPSAVFNEKGENVISCSHSDETLDVVRQEIDAVLRLIKQNKFPRCVDAADCAEVVRAIKPDQTKSVADSKACDFCQFGQLCEVSRHEYR